MNIVQRARILYILHRHAITQRLWESASAKLDVIRGLSAVERACLRELSTLFLYKKNILGAQGLHVSDEMRVTIAGQACLPVLKLGLDYYEGWSDLIVYPDVFRVSRNETDEFGIVHHQEHLLSGESWSQGPVILSWHDIEEDMRNPHEGHNVIVHETAHKLDMLNGKANGMPPLHRTMQRTHWTTAFSEAFELINQRLELHRRVCVNPYAATSPAECFAVFSEYFFSAPDILSNHFADVYQQLRLYYRQDPLSRMSSS